MLRTCRLFCLVLMFSLTMNSEARAHDSKILAALSGAKGIAAVTFTYAVLNGLAGWIWAYNWTRAGYTVEQTGRIQEGGGLAQSVVTWVFGGFIPLYLYLYLDHVKKHQARDAAALRGPAANLAPVVLAQSLGEWRASVNDL
jgi:hypothetical protein